MNSSIYINEFKTETKNNFTFSEFQNKACGAIVNDKHVLVTAHTGSGKTLPAEFAIYYFIKYKNKKVIYTSPIKALSNQKYKEFSEKFPGIQVGILTGDIKHNPNADLLIMTTEILQNNCFKKNNRGLYLDFNINIEEELGCVIFDEVHYIDDMDRGTVWEQTMIMLPDNVPFVMLSATIGQKEVFANWIKTIKNKDVVICHNNERVVPLTFYEYFSVPNKYIDNIPDKDKDKKKLFLKKCENKLNIIKTPKIYNYSHLNQTRKCIHELNKSNFIVHQKFVINDCLEYLKNNDMFPALMFIFSRKQVEKIAQQISIPLYLEGEKDFNVEPIYRQLIVSKINNWKEYIELPEYSFYLDLLEKGIGIHHAGMLPVFREIIEILYEQRCIKVLIATETFAIGLNMPTRTVLFNSLYKHDGTKLRLLKSHEFIQMAGRAGRRNIDTIGHVILMTNNYECPTENEYYNLLHSSPKILKSRFRLTYNLLLNYLNNYNKVDFVKMVEKSLMNLDIKHQINTSKTQIKKYEQKEENLLETIKELNFDVINFFDNYYNLKEKIKYSNNKDKKKINRQLKNIEGSKEFNQQTIYKYYNDNKFNINKEKDILNYSENYVKNQINVMYNILKDNYYLDDSENATQFALNASYIHEIPCLVFTDFYNYYEKLMNYSDLNIMMILSCFYDLKIKDEIKVINPPYLKNEMDFIKKRLNYYTDRELPNELYISCCFTLQYDVMDLIKEWYENVNDVNNSKFFFDKLKREKDIFIGDFIKCCLKIVNICNELKVFCENDENYSLMEKINNIQMNIQKNIVSNKSLYL